MAKKTHSSWSKARKAAAKAASEEDYKRFLAGAPPRTPGRGRYKTMKQKEEDYRRRHGKK